MNKMLKDYTGVIKEINEEERTLTVLISTPDVDRMGEVIDPMGVDLTNYQKNPVVLWAHNYDQPPIAKSLWVKKTKDGILAKPQFALTQAASEIYHLYKDGFLNCWSVGFMPVKWEDGQKDGEPKRRYTECELLEYSAVPVPANPQAITQIRAVVKSGVVIKAVEEEQKKLEDAAILPEKTYKQSDIDSLNEQIVVLTANQATDEMKEAADNATLLAEELKTAQDTIKELELKAKEGKPDDGQVPIEVAKKAGGITAGEAQAIIEKAMAGAVTKEFNRILGKV